MSCGSHLKRPLFSGQNRRMLASQRHDLSIMGLEITTVIHFPRPVGRGRVTFHGTLAGRETLAKSLSQRGIDITLCYICRPRQLVYISTLMQAGVGGFSYHRLDIYPGSWRGRLSLLLFFCPNGPGYKIT